MKTVLVVTMLIGGVPSGSPIQLEATTVNCQFEINTINGFNKYFEDNHLVLKYDILECKTN